MESEEGFKCSFCEFVANSVLNRLYHETHVHDAGVKQQPNESPPQEAPPTDEARLEESVCVHGVYTDCACCSFRVELAANKIQAARAFADEPGWDCVPGAHQFPATIREQRCAGFLAGYEVGDLAGYARGQEKSAAAERANNSLTDNLVWASDIPRLTAELSSMRARLEGAEWHISKALRLHPNAITLGIRLQIALDLLKDKKEE